LVEVNGLLIDRISETIEAGMVGVNTGLISIEIASFNGVRQPGRDGAFIGWMTI